MHSQFKLPPLPPYPVENDPPRISVKLSDLPPYPSVGPDHLVAHTPTTPIAVAERTSPHRAQPEPPAAPRLAPIKTHRWPSMNLHELEDLGDFPQSPTTVANMLVPDAPQPIPLPPLPNYTNELILTAAHIVAALLLPHIPGATCSINQGLPNAEAKPQADSKRRLPAQDQRSPVTKRGKLNADGKSSYSLYRRRIDALLKTATPQMVQEAKLIAERRIQESNDPSKLVKRRYRFKRSALLKMVRQLPQRAPTPPPREAPRAQIFPASAAAAFFAQAARSLDTEGLPPDY